MNDGEFLVVDASTDHKGNVPLRSQTGLWRASLFIIGNEILFYFILFDRSGVDLDLMILNLISISDRVQ